MRRTTTALTTAVAATVLTAGSLLATAAPALAQSPQWDPQQDMYAPPSDPDPDPDPDPEPQPTFDGPTEMAPPPPGDPDPDPQDGPDDLTEPQDDDGEDPEPEPEPEPAPQDEPQPAQEPEPQDEPTAQPQDDGTSATTGTASAPTAPGPLPAGSATPVRTFDTDGPGTLDLAAGLDGVPTQDRGGDWLLLTLLGATGALLASWVAIAVRRRQQR